MARPITITWYMAAGAGVVIVGLLAVVVYLVVVHHNLVRDKDALKRTIAKTRAYIDSREKHLWDTTSITKVVSQIRSHRHTSPSFLTRGEKLGRRIGSDDLGRRIG